MLVKALPHVGDKHGETVCCAGVTINGEWRRLFPVSFRSLDKERKFNRWDWIEYNWRSPKSDRRPESRHVQENSIRVLHKLVQKERHTFLQRIVRQSVLEAEEAGETLVLIRPKESWFYWEEKSPEKLEQQSKEYQAAASQLSFFADDKRPLVPCPFEFKFRYRSADGQPHTATCDDWETSATYFRLERRHGSATALERMSTIFNQQYVSAGMAFAMGTHSRFPKTWLLVGIIRLDETTQQSLEV
ncbi:hypothetical protein [Pelagibius sp.]|uniref:hypothetical protein n=1 Tax=Pelagibius sp. TaxID=1931238 RepID=UPI002612FC9F|nr:hypothetical protein [Pelagibius sp.]